MTVPHAPDDELRPKIAALLTAGASARAIARELSIGRDRAARLIEEVEAQRVDLASHHRRAMSTLSDALDTLGTMAAAADNPRDRLAILREARLTAAQLDRTAHTARRAAAAPIDAVAIDTTPAIEAATIDA